MKPSEPTVGLSRRYLLIVALLAVALYVLVPQLGGFQSSWHLLKRPAVGWTAVAIGLTLLTYFTGAVTYCLLSLKPLKYWPTVLMQFAAMFINRLLPAGLGAIGVNYTYLRRSRHGQAQAAAVVALNNTLGAVGHGLLALILILVVSGPKTALLFDYGHEALPLIKILAVATLLFGFVVAIYGRRRVKRQALKLRHQLSAYAKRPAGPLGALVSSMFLTLFNVLCLMACSLAVGVHLPLIIIFLIFTFGIGAGTVTPVPGGLGGFEAGLTAGFVAYHVPAPAALASALLYRLVSYWLPLVFGAAAFVVSRRQELL